MLDQRVEFMGVGHTQVKDQPVVERPVQQVHRDVEIRVSGQMPAELCLPHPLLELGDTWGDEPFPKLPFCSRWTGLVTVPSAGRPVLPMR